MLAAALEESEAALAQLRWRSCDVALTLARGGDSNLLRISTTCRVSSSPSPILMTAQDVLSNRSRSPGAVSLVSRLYQRRQVVVEWRTCRSSCPVVATSSPSLSMRRGPATVVACAAVVAVVGPRILSRSGPISVCSSFSFHVEKNVD